MRAGVSIARTRVVGKLAEAQFFLDLMREYRDDAQRVGFCLSAFLTAFAVETGGLCFRYLATVLQASLSRCALQPKAISAPRSHFVYDESGLQGGKALLDLCRYLSLDEFTAELERGCLSCNRFGNGGRYWCPILFAYFTKRGG